MIKVESLVINITDICNMECPFCLRGDRKGRKLDLSLIPKIFEGIEEVESLTITGGEPSCNADAVTAIVNYLKEHKDDIYVGGFFIATNGKEYKQELVDAVKDMFFIWLEKNYEPGHLIAGGAKGYAAFLDDMKYMFSIAVSIDKFHEPIPLENWFKYYISGVYSNAKEMDYGKTGVIARGWGDGLKNSYYKEYRELHVEKEYPSEITAGEVYVSVDGCIYGDCDMSYEMEEYNEPAGDLSENTLAEILKQKAKEMGENE